MKKRRNFLKEQRREVILNKATELFARKDYYEVMMDDVAHLSKVAKGTLYNYFDSKEELYNQIILNNLGSLLDSLKSSLSNELSIIELLYTYVSGVYQFLISHKNFFRIYQKFIWKEDEEINSAIKLKSEELSSLLSDIIYKGKRENLLREVDEDFAVRLILGNIFSSVKRSIDNNFSEEQLNIEKENLFDFIIHSVYAGFDNSMIRPLKNKTVVLTRTVEQSAESAAAFTELGAKVIIFPTLEIVPPSNWKSFDEIILDKNKIDFIIFTSV